MRYAHPTPENKRKAVDVLINIFKYVSQRRDESLEMKDGINSENIRN